MKKIQYLLGIISAFALVFVLLITSVEAVAYWTPGYYEKEYTKYRVTEAVHMEMDDLLEVTQEMMSFLRGDRPNLIVPTIVDGQPREFFNAREIAHMEDVQDLFVGAILLRRFCLIFIVLTLIILIRLKADLKQVLPRSVRIGTGVFFLIITALAGIISTNFNKYFTIFHEIFFSNDLWILDPRTDLLINIVPEPFFIDTAARIACTFGISVLFLFIVSTAMIRKQK